MAAMELPELRLLVRDVVVKACALTSDLQQSLIKDEATSVLSKDDFSPVTVTDFACQALITLLLEPRCPLPMLGEEDAQALRNDERLAAEVHSHVEKFLPGVSVADVIEALDRGRHEGGLGSFWVLDPIDGTKGFLRKEQYAICLCMVKDGTIMASALGCPNLPAEGPGVASAGGHGCVFHAAKGRGAAQLDLRSGEERTIRVDQEAANTYVESYESAHSSHGAHSQIAERLKLQPPLRMDSQCKFGVVARGQASLYLRLSDREQKIWDIAPGTLVVEEAGGQVSDSEGRPLCFSLGRTVGVRELLASNGTIHGQTLEAIAACHRP